MTFARRGSARFSAPPSPGRIGHGDSANCPPPSIIRRRSGAGSVWKSSEPAAFLLTTETAVLRSLVNKYTTAHSAHRSPPPHTLKRYVMLLACFAVRITSYQSNSRAWRGHFPTEGSPSRDSPGSGGLARAPSNNPARSDLTTIAFRFARPVYS